MIERMHLDCGRSGCDGPPCKHRRAARRAPAPEVSTGVKDAYRPSSRVDKDIARFPPAIQEQIRRKLGGA